MRRTLDLLGITRPRGAPRPKLLSVLTAGVTMFLVTFGIAEIARNVTVGNAGPIWIGSAMIVIGVACWVTGAVLTGPPKGER